MATARDVEEVVQKLASDRVRPRDEWLSRCSADDISSNSAVILCGKTRGRKPTKLDSKVNQLQKTKEQLSAYESRRGQAQKEDDEAKKQGQDASLKLEES
ncbi:hypothetical protein ZWY2020_044097 [Hordeum vulgare]|nr:hypothetical protein ZWY2020_044097 [Hordeum vulgare]